MLYEKHITETCKQKQEKNVFLYVIFQAKYFNVGSERNRDNQHKTNFRFDTVCTVHHQHIKYHAIENKYNSFIHT